MKYLAIAIVLILMTISACRKKDVQPYDDSQPVLSTDYFPMKAGNYWIYEQFETDSNGNKSSLNIFDSIYVLKDTLINGNRCWKVAEPSVFSGSPFTIYQPEGELLKIHNGSTIFSATNFSTPISFYAVPSWSGKDTAYTALLQMTDYGASVKVKAGSFVSITARTTLKAYNNDCPTARLFPIRKNIYSYKVGLIYQSLPLFCTSDKSVHRELIRYHLN